MNEKKLDDMNIELEPMSSVNVEIKFPDISGIIDSVINKNKLSLSNINFAPIKLLNYREVSAQYAYNSQSVEKKSLPVHRFWKTPPKFDLLLIQHKNVPMIDNLPKNIEIPTLIKYEDQFFIYGLSENKEVQIKKLEMTTNLSEHLNSLQFNVHQKIRVYCVEHDRIYSAITRQKCHIQPPKPPAPLPLNKLCINAIASDIIENSAKYDREKLPPEINESIDRKMEKVTFGIENEKYQEKNQKILDSYMNRNSTPMMRYGYNF